jgi:hypothetical protein
MWRTTEWNCLVCNFPGKVFNIDDLILDKLFKKKKILIEKNWVSLSTLAFIWAFLAVFMLGSAILFLDWRFTCLNRRNTTDKDGKNAMKFSLIDFFLCCVLVEINSSQDSLARHLTNPLFVVVTLFLSCLLLTVAFLPVVWFPWIMHLTGHNLELGQKRIFNTYRSFHISFF